MSSLTSFDWDSDDGEGEVQNVTEEMNAEDHIIEIKK